MVKLGMIGWGDDGKGIADLIHYKMKNVDLLAISSTEDDAINYAKTDLGLKYVFRDYKRLLEFHEIDGVIINNSPEKSVRQIEDSLKVGLHTLANNPIATNVSDALEIIEKSNQYSTRYTAAGLIRRYDPNLILARRKLNQGVIGDMISISLVSVRYQTENEIKQRLTSTSPGIFMECMSEDVDTVRFLSDTDFVEVFARGSTKKYPFLERHNDADSASCNAILENGVIVNLFTSRTDQLNTGFTLEVTGTKGKLTCSNIESADGIQIEDKKGVKRIFVPNTYDPPLQSMIDNFAQCIFHKKKPANLLPHAKKATQAAVAMTKSFLLKEAVRLGD